MHARVARSCFRWAFIMYHAGDHEAASVEMDDSVFFMERLVLPLASVFFMERLG